MVSIIAQRDTTYFCIQVIAFYKPVDGSERVQFPCGITQHVHSDKSAEVSGSYFKSLGPNPTLTSGPEGILHVSSI